MTDAPVFIESGPPSPFKTEEFEFVVACVVWPRTPDWSLRIVDLAGRVKDWRKVVALVDRHRVASLAFNAFSEAAIPAPADVHAALAFRARAETVQELRAAYETTRLVRLLRAADIDVIVVKGVTTALAAFGRLGLRHSMDIDLLVGPAQVPEASSALRAAGYVRTEPPEDATAATMKARMIRYKDLVFTHAETGVIIELHWRLFQNPTLLGEVRGGGVTVIPGGGSVPSLDPSVALLYLCLHGAEHAWARLKWLADLAAIVGSNADLAAGLYEQARKRGLRRLVGPGLILSHQLFDTPVPTRLRSDLAGDGRMRWLVKSNREALFGDEDGLELEDQNFATTRKNLGHYVASDNPAYWYREFIYDILDGADGGGVPGRLWKLLSKVTSSLARRLP